MSRPAWPFTLNESSDRASGLVCWWPVVSDDEIYDLVGSLEPADGTVAANYASRLEADAEMSTALRCPDTGPGAGYLTTGLGSQSGPYTIAVWMKLAEGASGIAWGAGVGYALYVTGTGGSDDLYHNCNGTFVSVSLSGHVIADTWVRIVITRSSTSIKFYLNGTQIGTTQTLSNPDDLASLVALCERGDQSFILPGLFVDFLFANRAWSDAEIAADYAEETRWDLYLTEPPPPEVDYGMVSLSPGGVYDLAEDTVYALPAKACLFTFTGSGTPQYSMNGVDFTDLTLDDNNNFNSAAPFIRSHGDDGVIAVKAYTLFLET